MSTEVEKKKIAMTRINKGNKRGDKIPRLRYLVPGDTIATVSCPRGQNNREGARYHVVSYPWGKDIVRDKINCYTGTKFWRTQQDHLENISDKF